MKKINFNKLYTLVQDYFNANDVLTCVFSTNAKYASIYRGTIKSHNQLIDGWRVRDDNKNVTGYISLKNALKAAIQLSNDAQVEEDQVFEDDSMTTFIFKPLIRGYQLFEDLTIPDSVDDMGLKLLQMSNAIEQMEDEYHLKEYNKLKDANKLVSLNTICDLLKNVSYNNYTLKDALFDDQARDFKRNPKLLYEKDTHSITLCFDSNKQMWTNLHSAVLDALENLFGSNENNEHYYSDCPNPYCITITILGITE